MTSTLQRGPLAAETLALLRIAAPLAAAHLAEFAMLLTTKMVVGRQGYEALAAVGLGADITFELMVVGMGLLSVVGVLAAHAEGAGDRGGAGHAARQGLLVGAAVAIPATFGVWVLGPALEQLGQEPVVVALATPYLRALAWSILPVLWFSVLRLFVAAVAGTASVMVITVAAVGLNYLLTLGLVEGRFGLPALGVAGAGWATTAVSWLMLLALAAYIYLTPALRGFGLFRARLRVDPRVCLEIARLGVPVAGLVLLEGGLFMAVSILSGLLGTTALASYQVLIAWVGIPFMAALGVAEATMVRVARGAGETSVARARRAGLLGMGLGIAVTGVLVVVPLAYPQSVVSMFLDPLDPGSGPVLELATGLFVIVALFQVFDGLQATASRALRGLRDTIVPLWIAGVCYWGLGIGGGAWLAFGAGLGAAGLWWGMAIGLITTGVALAVRFLRLTRAAGRAGVSR